MKREEAIKWLIRPTVSSTEIGEIKAKELEAYEMAIEALRREIPKNPVVNFVSDSDGSRRLDEAWAEYCLLCPVCHTHVGEAFDELYCRKCGQKIVQKRVRVIV